VTSPVAPGFRVLVSGQGFLEAPVAHGTGVLFADASAGVVLGYASGTTRPTPVSRRGIGGAALHVADGIVVTGRDVCWYSLASSDVSPVVLVARDREAGLHGFNDLVTSSDGSLYVGSLGGPPAHDLGELARATQGRIHHVGVGGEVREVASDLGYPNGLALSDDGALLYACDSARREVLAFGVLDDGSLGPARVFARTPDGIPDGALALRDGSLVVAVHGTGELRCWWPDGRERARFDTGRSGVTSLAAARGVLYVTCAGDSSEEGGALIAAAWPEELAAVPRPSCAITLTAYR
jgi:sugar lactone lactonase YvrE